MFLGGSHAHIRLARRYEAKLTAEREVGLRLKGENGIMKKKFNALQKDIEDQRDEIKTLFEHKKELYQVRQPKLAIYSNLLNLRYLDFVYERRMVVAQRICSFFLFSIHCTGYVHVSCCVAHESLS